MHLFFNDPRVLYVTRHRRVEQHPMLALVAGGVGVAALGVVIGAVGWVPPQQGIPAPMPAQQGVAMPDPVQDVNLFGVPAAPQPVLELGGPPRTLAAPAKPHNPATAARPGNGRTEKATAPGRHRTPDATADRTATATTEPTPDPTTNPSPDPTPSTTAIGTTATATAVP